jgi:hypothetical protein
LLAISASVGLFTLFFLSFIALLTMDLEVSFNFLFDYCLAIDEPIDMITPVRKLNKTSLPR